MAKYLNRSLTNSVKLSSNINYGDRNRFDAVTRTAIMTIGNL